MNCVYTAIFGARDELRDPPKPGSTKFICFTDQDLKSAVWEIRKVPLQGTPRRTARWCKALSHVVLPECERTLWTDGKALLLDDPAEIFLSYPDPLYAFRHGSRNCIYAELVKNHIAGKETPEMVQRITSRYLQEGYPRQNGLADTTCLIRTHTDQIKKFNEMWWSELLTYSLRDQLSFNYVCWKLGLSWSFIAGSSFAPGSKHFLFLSHKS
jgi:hypothetical protein